MLQILSAISLPLFALATGVGKTRLMGAHHLSLSDGEISSFHSDCLKTQPFQKTIDDFTPGNAKYVFQG